MGHLSLWATRTGRKDIVTILEQTIAEEKAADKKLTAIAEARSIRKRLEAPSITVGWSGQSLDQREAR